MPVKPTPVNDLVLTKQQLGAIEEQSQKQVELEREMASIYAVAQRARYKLELVITGDRKRMDPWSGVLTFWESGAMLHGGGDALIYLCPGKHRKVSDCESPIPTSGHADGAWVCPKCHTRWEAKQVIGQIGCKLTPQNWAKVLHKYYLGFGGNADIVMTYMPELLRSASAKEQQKQLGGELLTRVRGKRTKLVYPLAHIIRDTSAGAGLYDRILAFLKAS